MKNVNVLPTPAERERLTKLAEEASEVIKVCCKIQSHGYMAEANGIFYDNRADLEGEIADFQAATRLMTRENDVDSGRIKDARRAKLLIIKQYMSFQG